MSNMDYTKLCIYAIIRGVNTVLRNSNNGEVGGSDAHRQCSMGKASLI